MRLAWFGPLPPTRSGIAPYAAELIPRLGERHEIDLYVNPAAGRPAPLPHAGTIRRSSDFVHTHLHQPYELMIYQLGNARCHDFLWAYMTRYPGLVILHDAVVHQSRAAQLLTDDRAAAYRAELSYDQPALSPDAAELAITGTESSLYYEWPLLRPVVQTARLTAVHNTRIAADLSTRYPGIMVDAIRMGVADPLAGVASPRKRAADAPVRFAAFGLVTPEKRIAVILKAFAQLSREADVRLRLVGATTNHYDVVADIRRLGLQDRVELTGYVPAFDLAAELVAADICLCLRWPTARETSGSWLRAVAAGKPTIVSRLTHLAGVPVLDPITWLTADGGDDAIGVGIDVLDEEVSLLAAMRRLAADVTLRDALGRRAWAYWQQDHTVSAMVDDYERVLARAVASDAPPPPTDLPEHFRGDGTELGRSLMAPFGLAIDVLENTAGASTRHET